MVVFSLDGEEYALPVARVQEIIRFTAPRTIGSTVRWLRGVISLRGRIVPVCDLASRFGRGPTAETAETKIVIVEGAGNVAGVVVDGVSEVLTLAADQVDELPAAGADFQSGVAKVAERLIVLLDPDRLLGGIEDDDALAGAVDDGLQLAA